MLEYINKSYRRQLMFYFTLVSVVPLVLSGLLLVGMFRTRVHREFATQDLGKQQLIEQRLEEHFSTVEEVITQIADDADIQKALAQGTVSSSNIYAALYRETQAIRPFSTVDIYTGEKRIYTTDRGTVSKTLPSDFGIIARLETQPEATAYVLNYDGIYTRETSLQIGRKINVNAGYVIVTIDQSDFENILKESYNGNEGVLLLNAYWEPIYAGGNLASGANLQLFRTNRLEGRRLNETFADNLYATAVGDTGLTLVYMTPPALSEDIFRMMFMMLLIITVLVLIGSLTLSGYVSNFLAQPIQKLSDGMRALRHGDLSAHVELPRDDELGQLADGFNKTTVRIRRNMEERVQQQKHLNETEMRMMQAQLNPHFLYNTLDTIKWVAKAHQVPEIVTLSSDLAKILRRSISGREFETLQEELELLESYCNIQELRFDDSFSFEVEVPEELMSCMVPKLTLQPIVENAIIHGLEGVEDGLVKVTARRVEEELEIHVLDNGCGIEDAFIEMVKKHDGKLLSGHLGFANVDSIIRLNYGPQYGIDIARLPEGGTDVVLRLPYQKEQMG